MNSPWGKVDYSTNAYADYLATKEYDRLRQSESPDLIISAIGIGSNSNSDNDIVKVTTADGLTHYVTKFSYAMRTKPNLLSNCVLY